MGQQKDTRGHARKRVHDIAGVPTTPHPTLWQYTSTHYDAESSLSSLSLVASDSVTRSRPAQARDIDKMDTQPPAKRRRSIDEINTRPPRKQMWLEQGYDAVPTVIMPKIPMAHPKEFSRQQEQASWTAGGGANSRYARRIIEPQKKRGRARSGLPPFDSLRWWLLYPGRIEFLVLVVGALLLICLSVLLLPLTFFSFVTSSPGPTTATAKQASPALGATVTSLCVVSPQGHSTCDAVRVTSPTGLEITLLNTGQAQEGAPLQLRGRGFSALSQVSFTCDTHWECRPASLRVDAQGTFLAKLMPTDGTDWVAGWHQIVVNDMVTHHSVSLPFTLLTMAPSVPTTPTTTLGTSA